MLKVEQVQLKDIGRVWFDDPEQIEKAAKDLNDFALLIRMRNQYGDFRSAPLMDHVVGGLWNLDCFGQTANRIMDNHREPYPEKVQAELKVIKENMHVFSPDQFQAIMSQAGFTGDMGFRMGGGMFQLPARNESCTVCETSWKPDNVDDCFDYGAKVYLSDSSIGFLRMQHPAQNIPESFVGMTILEIEELNLTYHMRPVQFDYNNPFKNKKYIDLTPNPENRDRPRNAEGYLSTHYSDDGKPYRMERKTYQVQEGDIPVLYVQGLAHKECISEDRTQKVKDRFLRVFFDADIRVKGTLIIPNSYTDSFHMGNWFIIQTEKKFYRVGWRRHVISLMEITDPVFNYRTNDLSISGSTEDHHFNSYDELKEFLTMAPK